MNAWAQDAIRVTPKGLDVDTGSPWIDLLFTVILIGLLVYTYVRWIRHG